MGFFSFCIIFFKMSEETSLPDDKGCSDVKISQCNNTSVTSLRYIYCDIFLKRKKRLGNKKCSQQRLLNKKFFDKSVSKLCSFTVICFSVAVLVWSSQVSTMTLRDFFSLRHCEIDNTVTSLMMACLSVMEWPKVDTLHCSLKVFQLVLEPPNATLSCVG